MTGARLAALAGAALALAACGRVPEQALRDEQARSRRYRDAYESQAQELQRLKERVADLEKKAADAGCPAAGKAEK